MICGYFCKNLSAFHTHIYNFGFLQISSSLSKSTGIDAHARKSPNLNYVALCQLIGKCQSLQIIKHLADKNPWTRVH